MVFTGNLVARPAAGRGRADRRPAAPTGSPTPSPTSCATILATVRAGARAEGLPGLGRAAVSFPRLVGAVAERLDARRSRAGPLRAGRSTCSASSRTPSPATSSRARGRARLRPDGRRCYDGMRAASAGASSGASSSDGPDRARHRGQRLLRVGPRRPRPRPRRRASASSTSTRPTARDGDVEFVVGDVRDLRRGARGRARASTSCCTTSPRCRWPRTATCSGRSTSPAPPTCSSPRATPGWPRSCTRRRAPSSASPSATRSTRTTPGRPLEAYGRAKLEAEALCREAAAGGLDVTDRPAPHDPRPRPARASWPSCSSSWPRARRCSCSTAATTATSSCTPTTWPTPACGPPTGPGRPSYNIGATEFGTMRETLQALVDHAGTGSRVRSLPSAPARLGDAGAGRRWAWRRSRRTTGCCTASRCGSTPTKAAGRARLGARALQRVDGHRVLRVVPRPPRRRSAASTRATTSRRSSWAC